MEKEIKTESMIADFIKVQKELPKMDKSADNPFFKSKYVTLDQILVKVLPILNANNFALSQTVSAFKTDNGVVDTLITKLIHTSGATLGGEMRLMVEKVDPQKQGSAITYAKRYAITALLGVSADEDDDANRATHGDAKKVDVKDIDTSKEVEKKDNFEL